MVVNGEPGRQHRGIRRRCAQLAECNADGGAGKAVGGRRNAGRRLSGHDSFLNTPFNVDNVLVSVATQQFLKSRVTIPPESVPLTERVPRRMRRIKVRRWYPSLRQGFSRRVRSIVAQQSWEDVRVRTIGTLSIWRRDRLEDFDAPDAAEKDPMGVHCKNCGHRAVARSEERLSDPSPKLDDQGYVARAHARIQLQCTEP
jgi:hypothetical protein